MSSALLPNGLELARPSAAPGSGLRWVGTLTEELRGLRPLGRAVGRALRVPHAVADEEGSGSSAARSLVQRIARRLEMSAPELVESSASGLTAFDLAAKRRLQQSLDVLPVTESPRPEAVEEVMEASLRSGVDGWLQSSTARSYDGAALPVYTAGARENPAVLVVGPCGMPVELLARWILALSREHYVITWESRGLFDLTPIDEGHVDVAAQTNDARCVLEHVGVSQVHVMGLCGGAVLAVGAAVSSEQVTSLSLWHGDFAGCAAPRTGHQDDVAAAMSMAGASRSQAAAMHKLFARPSVLAGLRPDLAHLLIVPYATPELLFRYGRLNGSIMTTDLAPIAADVRVPTAVITSNDDVTAHPDGSKHVAKLLPSAALHVEPHGDHLALFDAPDHLVSLAARVVAHGARL